MNIICKISLSKKIRKMVGKNSNIVLSGVIDNGTGEGILSISNPNIGQTVELNGEETSIILNLVKVSGESRIIEASEEVDERVFNSNPVSSLFSDSAAYGTSNNPKAIRGVKRSPVDKIAATEVSKNVSEAIVPKDEVVVPEQFKATQEKKFVEFVKSFDQLLDLVRNKKSFKSTINPSDYENERERITAQYEKEIEESIGVPAFVINKKYASLNVDDCNLVFLKNAPVDIGRISAKKLYSSPQLMSLIKSGELEIISPKEAAKIAHLVQKQEEEDDTGTLDARTLDRIKRGIVEYDDDDDDNDDEENDYDNDDDEYGNINLEDEAEEDEESDITSLIGSSKARKTVHGNAVNRSNTSRSKKISNVARKNSKGIKTVARRS
jgi:hypothetical protein